MDLSNISNKDIQREKEHRSKVHVEDIGKMIADKIDKMKYHGAPSFTVEELESIREAL